MTLKGTLESRITYRVKRNADSVFLRKDFADIGGYDQVGRILRQLVNKGLLIDLGYGVYARTKRSSVTGKLVPEKPLPELAKEAMKKQGVKTAPTEAEKAYNEGRSTQVPTGRVIGVNRRVSRKLGYDGKYVTFKKVS